MEKNIRIQQTLFFLKKASLEAKKKHHIISALKHYYNGANKNKAILGFKSISLQILRNFPNITIKLDAELHSLTPEKRITSRED